MAWPTRSKVLLSSHNTSWTGGVDTDLGGPATGKVWLIKTMTLYGPTAASCYVKLKRSGVLRVVDQFSIAAGAVAVRTQTWVMEAGDTVVVSTSANEATMDFHLFGALLG